MRALKLLSAVTGLLLAMGLPAGAVTNGDGDLIATFDGGIAPKLLPRQVPAPVAVRVAGNFRSASRQADRLPQLRRMVVAINRGGRLFDRGLPVCTARLLQPSTEERAREVCGDTIVGSGHVAVQVRIPAQLPFELRARLLAFNGPHRNGRKLIFAQAYVADPPGSFVLTFRVDRRAGTYGTVLSTTLPEETREWAYLTHFDMTLRREYAYRGRQRSYVSATCAAPAGFRKAVFPFAKATYSFTNGQRLSLSQAAVCRVAGN